MALAGMQAGRVAPPLGSRAVTPPLPSALCSLPVCVERAQPWASVAGLVGPLPWLTTSPTPGLRL